MNPPPGLPERHVVVPWPTALLAMAMFTWGVLIASAALVLTIAAALA